MALKLQIITPEYVIFDGEVDSVIVPGKMGQFQMLENHAAIVSTLEAGKIEIHTHTTEFVDYNNEDGMLEMSPSDSKVMFLPVNGGIVEMNNNKCIILAE
ncbi:F0F1 ATP synthase subunit epsilon [Weeksellaceae bacterium KMM 9713]|uniref:F0F1 ATP synthase subunit epsilon n=1 Tax=Profundicola chukchiensis TaxID=2961959 RepID=A0A9X4N1V0_9FLAO|nr:F0F1 ATP synthase subunit epsilon [Profundicola chukchiensis]MDG4945024.1 F0F1 ATP synthase subunit epsilon [Profundicola chukchiensis]MDG4950107.1 F0F1 ATP synthase subunit epsilon [Profundicola chukchiensis]